MFVQVKVTVRYVCVSVPVSGCILKAGTVESLCMKPYVTLPLEPSSASIAWTCRTNVPAGWFSRTDVLSRYCWHWGGGEECNVIFCAVMQVWRDLDIQKIQSTSVCARWNVTYFESTDERWITGVTKSVTWTPNNNEWREKESRKPELGTFSIQIFSTVACPV